MDKEQRDAMRAAIENASPRKLRAALQALVDVAARAEMDFASGEERAGWFADGVDTAAASAGAAMGLPFKWVTSGHDSVVIAP
jgi:hypothetical protein